MSIRNHFKRICFFLIISSLCVGLCSCEIPSAIYGEKSFIGEWVMDLDFKEYYIDKLNESTLNVVDFHEFVDDDFVFCPHVVFNEDGKYYLGFTVDDCAKFSDMILKFDGNAHGYQYKDYKIIAASLGNEFYEEGVYQVSKVSDDMFGMISADTVTELSAQTTYDRFKFKDSSTLYMLDDYNNRIYFYRYTQK